MLAVVLVAELGPVVMLLAAVGAVVVVLVVVAAAVGGCAWRTCSFPQPTVLVTMRCSTWRAGQGHTSVHKREIN